MGADRPGGHFLGGGKIEVIPKNKQVLEPYSSFFPAVFGKSRC